MKFKRAIETFFIYLGGNGYSDTTIKLYGWALNLLSGYLGEGVNLEDITAERLSEFWNWLRHDYKPKRQNGKTEPLAGRSLENMWTAERSFFGWAIQTQRLEKRPDLNIRRPEYAEREIMPLSMDDIGKILKAAAHTRIANTGGRRTPFTMPRATARRDIAMISLLTDTGIRASECARLRRQDIDFDLSTITVQVYGTGRKTKERTIDIGKQTRMALWEYLLWREEKEQRDIEPDERVFISMRGNPMTKDSIRQVVEEIGLAAGIENVHPHRFRHTYASEMAGDDMGEDAIKYNLGQTSSKMARRYIHLHGRKKTKHVSPVDRIRKK